MSYKVSLALLVALVSVSQPVAQAQGAKATPALRARLSGMPFDLAVAPTMVGVGAVTATLSGSRLSLTGSYEGLSSPATVARIHKAQRGVRGPAILDLKVSGGAAGTLAGTFDLTPQQVQDVMNGRFCVQLHSEKAPDGNLWGWLLPQETKR